MRYKKKQEEKYKEEILLALPTFLNQLLLLLNSGVVLQEAVIKLAKSCGEAAEESKNAFSRGMSSALEESERSGENFLTVFCRFGRSTRIKEFSRICGIILDGGQKGVDMWEKLADESDELWKERKRVAMERMRVAESKLSFPLALMLVALLLVTAAPAMMQMYIN